MACVENLPIILASSSPRRRRLMAEAGYEFEVVDPPIAEPDQQQGETAPRELAEALAYFKGRCVWEGRPHRRVLSADTIVAVGGQILGKATDERHAGRMLGLLSGSRHAVITGVSLLSQGERLIAAETTFVTMRQLTAGEIDQYIESGQWRGKAGAYGIQGSADRFVEDVAGSYTNIVGLPMELVERMIGRLR